MDYLPSFVPRDSHSLWYTSTHSTGNQFNHQEASHSAFDHLTSHQTHGANSQRRSLQNALLRSPLARLRLDEDYMQRRKHNIQNYGNSWIKPPGISKSLYQQREEKRELEEHQEALRREQLAQELTDAEGADELLQGDDVDGEMEDPRDLDDDVPDADTTGLDAEDMEESEEEDDGTEEVPPGVLASRMPDDLYREALIRGEDGRPHRFREDDGSTIGDEDESQILQEEDLVHELTMDPTEPDMVMNMDADLDADIPDAESGGGYEHTDTDEELSSSEEMESESDLAGYSSRGILVASSMVRSDGTQSSVEIELRRVDLPGQISSVLSHAHETSISRTGSSPNLRSVPQGRR